MPVVLTVGGIAAVFFGAAGEMQVGEHGLSLPAVWVQVAVVVFGVTLLVAAFLLALFERKAPARAGARTFPSPASSPLPAEGEPIPAEGEPVGAEESARLELRGVDDTSEVVMYWGYRPSSHDDLRRTLETATGEVLVCGMGLNTLAEVFLTPDVLGHLVKQIGEHESFRLRLVTLDRPERVMAEEKGRERVRQKLLTGQQAIADLMTALKEELPAARVETAVDRLTYGPAVYPRHFLLRTREGDGTEVIYAGSYLSHQQGSRSYLIKLNDHDDGLFALFDCEADFIEETAVPFPARRPS